MITALNDKNNMGFVNGTLNKLDLSSNTHTTWSRCNNMVKSWILNDVSKEIAFSIMFENMASEMWLDLQERYAQYNASYVYKLHRDITLTTQDKNSISALFY